MSFLNFSFNIMAYEDQSVNNPQIRSLDVSKGITGITISNERTDKYDLDPGETVTVAATARALTQDNTTQYQINHNVISDDTQVRLEWIGGSTPGFATKRDLGIDATTTISITRINQTTSRITSVAGTNISTVSVLIGDIIKFEQTTPVFTSFFGVTNQTAFKVVNTGSNYIDVLDNSTMSLDQNIVLGSSFDKQIRCFSVGPVKIGDIVDISGVTLNANNVGKFQVTGISYDYVQFINPFAVDATFTNTSNIQVYDRLIGFLYIRSVNGVSFKINNGNYVRINKLGNQEAYYIGSIQAYKIDLLNDGLEKTSATVHQASIV